MSRWQLTDCLEPHEEPEAFPVIPVSSEEGLRAALAQVQRRRPGVVVLAGPDQARLLIYLGGPFAGLRWINGEVGQFALADQVRCPEGVEFVVEGVEDLFQPEELLPAEEVIEAAVYYFKNHHLPDFLTWKVWHPESDAWEIVPARRSLNGQPGPPGTGEKVRSADS
jgi:hypothetical protein